jgi:hypothetical protein
MRLALYVALALAALGGAVWYVTNMRDTERWIDGELRRVGR